MNAAVALGAAGVLLLLVQLWLGMTLLVAAAVLAVYALRRGGWTWSSTSNVVALSTLAGLGVGFLMVAALYLVAVALD
jgi:hypothetical protein